ncbi:ParA family protein [Aerosakkonemataceae cyanobacterium BLCC-F50]|uniref:ParA family protein n=1 Tax=Floridaenema flaviceps BLCC-F50 TaxID=3153642 RepID=A0ABV4XN28_9CYAN
MSKVIALFNQSGGVGKSSLTLNLGYHLAQRQHKVLLVDMDPQASLTVFMGLEPSELDNTIYESIMNGSPLRKTYSNLLWSQNEAGTFVNSMFSSCIRRVLNS